MSGSSNAASNHTSPLSTVAEGLRHGSFQSPQEYYSSPSSFSTLSSSSSSSSSSGRNPSYDVEVASAVSGNGSSDASLSVVLPLDQYRALTSRFARISKEHEVLRNAVLAERGNSATLRSQLANSEARITKQEKELTTYVDEVERLSAAKKAMERRLAALQALRAKSTALVSAAANVARQRREAGNPPLIDSTSGGMGSSVGSASTSTAVNGPASSAAASSSAHHNNIFLAPPPPSSSAQSAAGGGASSSSSSSSSSSKTILASIVGGTTSLGALFSGATSLTSSASAASSSSHFVEDGTGMHADLLVEHCAAMGSELEAKILENETLHMSLWEAKKASQRELDALRATMAESQGEASNLRALLQSKDAAHAALCKRSEALSVKLEEVRRSTQAASDEASCTQSALRARVFDLEGEKLYLHAALEDLSPLRFSRRKLASHSSTSVVKKQQQQHLLSGYKSEEAFRENLASPSPPSPFHLLQPSSSLLSSPPSSLSSRDEKEKGGGRGDSSISTTPSSSSSTLASSSSSSSSATPISSFSVVSLAPANYISANSRDNGWGATEAALNLSRNNAPYRPMLARRLPGDAAASDSEWTLSTQPPHTSSDSKSGASNAHQRAHLVHLLVNALDVFLSSLGCLEAAIAHRSEVFLELPTSPLSSPSDAPPSKSSKLILEFASRWAIVDAAMVSLLGVVRVCAPACVESFPLILKRYGCLSVASTDKNKDAQEMIGIASQQQHPLPLGVRPITCLDFSRISRIEGGLEGIPLTSSGGDVKYNDGDTEEKGEECDTAVNSTVVTSEALSSAEISTASPQINADGSSVSNVDPKLANDTATAAVPSSTASTSASEIRTSTEESPLIRTLASLQEFFEKAWPSACLLSADVLGLNQRQQRLAVHSSQSPQSDVSGSLDGDSTSLAPHPNPLIVSSFVAAPHLQRTAESRRGSTGQSVHLASLLHSEFTLRRLRDSVSLGLESQLALCGCSSPTSSAAHNGDGEVGFSRQSLPSSSRLLLSPPVFPSPSALATATVRDGGAPLGHHDQRGGLGMAGRRPAPADVAGMALPALISVTIKSLGALLSSADEGVATGRTFQSTSDQERFLHVLAQSAAAVSKLAKLALKTAQASAASDSDGAFLLYKLHHDRFRASDFLLSSPSDFGSSDRDARGHKVGGPSIDWLNRARHADENVFLAFCEASDSFISLSRNAHSLFAAINATTTPTTTSGDADSSKSSVARRHGDGSSNASGFPPMDSKGSFRPQEKTLTFSSPLPPQLLLSDGGAVAEDSSAMAMIQHKAISAFMMQAATPPPSPRALPSSLQRNPRVSSQVARASLGIISHTLRARQKALQAARTAASAVAVERAYLAEAAAARNRRLEERSMSLQAEAAKLEVEKVAFYEEQQRQERTRRLEETPAASTGGPGGSGESDHRMSQHGSSDDALGQQMPVPPPPPPPPSASTLGFLSPQTAPTRLPPSSHTAPLKATALESGAPLAAAAAADDEEEEEEEEEDGNSNTKGHEAGRANEIYMDDEGFSTSVLFNNTATTKTPHSVKLVLSTGGGAASESGGSGVGGDDSSSSSNSSSSGSSSGTGSGAFWSLMKNAFGTVTTIVDATAAAAAASATGEKNGMDGSSSLAPSSSSSSSITIQGQDSDSGEQEKLRGVSFLHRSLSHSSSSSDSSSGAPLPSLRSRFSDALSLPAGGNERQSSSTSHHSNTQKNSKKAPSLSSTDSHRHATVAAEYGSSLEVEDDESDMKYYLTAVSSSAEPQSPAPVPSMAHQHDEGGDGLQGASLSTAADPSEEEGRGGDSEDDMGNFVSAETPSTNAPPPPSPLSTTAQAEPQLQLLSSRIASLEDALKKRDAEAQAAAVAHAQSLLDLQSMHEEMVGAMSQAHQEAIVDAMDRAASASAAARRLEGELAELEARALKCSGCKAWSSLGSILLGGGRCQHCSRTMEAFK